MAATITGTAQAQSSALTASISNIVGLTGTVTAQNSSTTGTLGSASSITGTVTPLQARSKAAISLLSTSVVTLTGSPSAQSATINGRFGAFSGRDLPNAVLDELPKNYADMDLFLEMQFDNGTERYWTGVGDQDLNGNTFTGDGTIVNISSIRETLGLTSESLDVTLSGLNSTLRDNALKKSVQDRLVKLWIVFWDDNKNIIGDDVRLFTGRIDDMQLNVSNENPLINLQVETGAINWSRKRPRFYDPEDQKQEFSNDKGFDFVPQLGDLAITWGSETIRPPSNTGVRNIVYGTDKVEKPPVFYASPDNDCFLHVVQPAAAHEIDSFEKIYLDDRVAWTNSGGVQSEFSGNLRVNTHLGSDSQSADSDLKSEISEWTSDHRLRGVAYVYLRFKLSSQVYPQGLPKIMPVVNGKQDVRDIRDNTDKFTDNVSLCMRDFILDSELGLNNTTDNLDDDKFRQAANHCDDDIKLNSGGTEKRYTVNHSFDTDRSPRSILQEMSQAMAGFLTYTGGTFAPRAGVDYSVVGKYDRTDLAEDYAVSNKRSRSSRFNSIRGKFNSANEDWRMINYPSRVDSTAKTNDNSKNIWETLDLPATDSHTMAQRISKIALKRNREQKAISLTFNTRELLQNLPGDIIRFTDDFVNWSEKKFRITQLEFNFTKSNGGIKLIPTANLAEYNSDVYSWDESTDEKSITSGTKPTLSNSDDLHVQQFSKTSDFPSGNCEGQVRVAKDDGIIQIAGTEVGSGSTADSGQVTLSGGTATVDTGISASNAIFTLGLGVDDPDADTKVAGRMFWDDSAGNYKIEIKEVDTDVGNPTVNYIIKRID